MLYLRSKKKKHQINRNLYVIVTVEINTTSISTVIILILYSSYQRKCDISRINSPNKVYTQKSI